MWQQQFSLWVSQELRAQPQESWPRVSSQEEETTANLHLHHPSASWQEMPLLSADQIQRPGDNSFLHSRSGCKGEHLPLWLNHPQMHIKITDSLFNPPQLHYNSKTLKTESPNTSRGSSLPRTLSKESKLYGMKDSSPPIPPNAAQSKTNSLLPPPPPPIPSGTKHSLMSTCMPCNHHLCITTSVWWFTLEATKWSAYVMSSPWSMWEDGFCNRFMVMCDISWHTQEIMLLRNDL